MSRLPGRVLLPTRAALMRKLKAYDVDNPAAYVLGSARALARGEFGACSMAVAESDGLEPVCWSAFPIEVDDVRMIVDFSDFLVLDPAWTGHDHWLRFHYTSAFRPFPRLDVFPRQSFHDWGTYAAIRDELRVRRTPDDVRWVLNNQAPGDTWDDRHRRRLLVRGLLHYHFPRQVDFAWTRQEDFWMKGATALCYVHVPGSSENMIDRGWVQMFALGVPVVSPYMHDYLWSGGAPVPGEHYVACRDDYADLHRVVAWCLDHREEVFRVGEAAREFFRAVATPPAIWAALRGRLDGTSAAGCDLPAGSVRCKHPA